MLDRRKKPEYWKVRNYFNHVVGTPNRVVYINHKTALADLDFYLLGQAVKSKRNKLWHQLHKAWNNSVLLRGKHRSAEREAYIVNLCVQDIEASRNLLKRRRTPLKPETQAFLKELFADKPSWL